MTLQERIQKYLDRCEPAVSGTHGHDATFRVTCALIHGFGLDPETAFGLLKDFYNPRCEPPWSDTELGHKVRDACNTQPLKERGYLLGPGAQVAPLSDTTGELSCSSVPKAVYDPVYLESFTAELTTPIDNAYLESRSQFSCHNRSPAGFLHKIFHPGEHVWVSEKTASSQGLLWTHEGLVQNLTELDHLRKGRPGVWFLSNPVDGQPHQLERLKSQFNAEGISFRASECITNWRHAVLETDDAPEELWLKALALLPLPIIAIYHSGKRGAHAVLNLGAKTPKEWHQRLAPHCEHLQRLGACSGTLRPVCLSRLPNCMRGQTKRLQQLLYLTPDADGTPIAKRPVREDPSAVWDRPAPRTRLFAQPTKIRTPHQE